MSVFWTLACNWIKPYLKLSDFDAVAYMLDAKFYLTFKKSSQFSFQFLHIKRQK